MLGYTWSTRKGDEGIKLTTDRAGKHLTPMYNPSNRDDQTKYSYHIAANFKGSLNIEQASSIEHLQVTQLIDMVNFWSATFDKTISLSPTTTKVAKWKPGVSVQPLGELVEIYNGFTPDTNNSVFWENGIIPWVTLEDLKSKYVAASTRQITKKALGKRSLLPKNTVLWSSRATIGRVAITARTVMTNQGFKNLVIKDNNKLLPEYLYYLLQYLESDLKSLVPQGSKYKEINTETLKQFTIPVPSPEVQKQIIDECKKIDEEVDTAEKDVAGGSDKKKKILETVTDYSNSRSLGELCRIKYGKSLREDRRRADGSVPVAGAAGVVGYHDEPLSKGCTIVIGRKGSVGTVTYLAKPCFPIDTTFYIDEVKTDIDLRYLYLSLVVRENDLKELRGGTGVPGLNVRVLEKLSIPVPSPEVQKQIIDECKKIDEEVDTAEKVVAEGSGRKREVFRSKLEP